MQTEKRSIVNRLFDIRNELDELGCSDDPLYRFVSVALEEAIAGERQGFIPGDMGGEQNMETFYNDEGLLPQHQCNTCDDKCSA